MALYSNLKVSIANYLPLSTSFSLSTFIITEAGGAYKKEKYKRNTLFYNTQKYIFKKKTVGDHGFDIILNNWFPKMGDDNVIIIAYKN